MRVKLYSDSKKLPLKCWYSFTLSKKRSTILELKKKLVTDLGLPYKTDEFKLEMDTFELLENSNVNNVLCDNDTLSIQLIQKKRKAPEVEEKPVVKKQKTKHVEKTERVEKTKEKPKKVTKKTNNKSIKDKAKKIVKKKAEEKKKAEAKKKADEKKKKKAKKVELKENNKKESGKKKSEKKEAKKKSEKTEQEGLKPISKKKPVKEKVLTKTQRRNLRRRLLKQKLRESKRIQQENQQANQQESHQENELIQIDSTTEQQQQLTMDEQASEMIDYNPYGRALVTSIECAPNFSSKKKNNKKPFKPREYPVHKVAPLFYAQQHVESYFVPQTISTEQYAMMEESYHIEDPYLQNNEMQIENELALHDQAINNNTKEHQATERESDSDSESDDDEEEEEENNEEEEENNEEEEENNEEEEENNEEEEENNEEEEEEESVVQENEPLKVDYDTLAVLNFHDNPPQVNDRLAIKLLELTSTYTPEISDWKHVLLKEINAESVVVEFEEGFGKASTKGGKFDIRKKKQKRHYFRGRRQIIYEEETDEADENVQDYAEENTATVSISDIFEVRKLA